MSFGQLDFGKEMQPEPSVDLILYSVLVSTATCQEMAIVAPSIIMFNKLRLRYLSTDGGVPILRNFRENMKKNPFEENLYFYINVSCQIYYYSRYL